MSISDRENPISAVGRKNHTRKIMIGLAVEILQPKGFGRIRLRRLSSDTKECVREFIQESVNPSAVVRTDGSGSYAKLHQIGYNHERNSCSDHRSRLMSRSVWVVSTLTAESNVMAATSGRTTLEGMTQNSAKSLRKSFCVTQVTAAVDF